MSLLTIYKKDKLCKSIYKETALCTLELLNDKDIHTLIQYQDYVCEFYEWVELDEFKLLHIIELLTLQLDMHKDIRMQTLKKAIRTYYKLRITLVSSTPEEDIICEIVWTLNSNPYIDDSDLFSRIVIDFIERGGNVRDGHTLNIYQ